MRKLEKILLFSILLNFFLGSSASAGDPYSIWSEFEQEQIQVYLGFDQSLGEVQVVKLSNSGVNISPTSIETGGVIWSAWVDRSDEEKYVLHYNVLDRSGFSTVEEGLITTSDKTVFSPILSPGDDGRIWIVWSGFDGEDEEIRIAYWRQGKWSKEIPLTDNNVPDTLPAIKITDNGKIDVTWEQLNEEGFVLKQFTFLEDDFTKFDPQSKALNFRSLDTHETMAVSGASGRESMEKSLSFVKEAHPDFIKLRLSNILMGSTIYSEKKT